jgi:hypothetical protein
VPESTGGAGHCWVCDEKHTLVAVSQQLTPFVTAGQLFWQSWSEVQEPTHFLVGGGWPAS